jgi:hypothetical protein
MTTNTATNLIVPASAVDSLLGAYRAHVLGRPLPTPVTVTFNPDVRQISVQAGGNLDLCSRLANLLVWAYTLADVTATWWHTPDETLHATITGRTTGGTRMKVYAGGPFDQTQGLVQLDLDQREGVSLDELYTLANLLREAQHEREAA